MVRIVEFSPSSQAANLAALKERRASLDQAMVDNLKPQEMRSPWQGAAQLAQSAMLGLRQGNIARQEAGSREELSKILAGIGPEGPTMEQAAAAGMIDSDLGKSLLEGAIAARRADTEYQRARTDKLTDRGAEWGHEAAIDTREVGQEEAINTRELGETKDAETRAAETKRIEEERKAKAGAQRMVTGDEAKALGGDPTRTYRVSADGTTLEDATPNPETTYEAPITGDEAAAQGLDPNGTWQKSSAGKWEDIRKTGGFGGPAGIKALTEMQSEASNYDSNLANLDRAMELIPKIPQELIGGLQTKLAEFASYGGPMAVKLATDWASSAGYPVTPEQVNDLMEYNRIVGAQAITAMSTSLKGASTNFEMREFQKVMADPASTIEQRTRAVNNLRNGILRDRDNINTTLTQYGQPLKPYVPTTTASAAPAAAVPAAAAPAAPAAAPAAAPEQDYQEGTTATGPNGEKIVLKNGQWVPQ